MKKFLSVILLFFLPAGAFAQSSPPPIEVYGGLPEIRSVALSPDGSHFAFLAYRDGQDMLLVYKRGEGLVGGINTEAVKARSVDFAGDDFVILLASETQSLYGYDGAWENSAAFSYSLDNQKVTQLLLRTKDVYTAQSGLGRIVGFFNDDENVLMPAYSTRHTPPANDLFMVSLEYGKGSIAERGNDDTIDWIVDREGEVLAREEYNNRTDRYRIFTKKEGEWRQLLEVEQAERIPFSLMGVKPDASALILVDRDEDEEFSSVYELDFEGNRTGPYFQRAGASVEAVLNDVQRSIIGVRYTGIYPEYEFYDDALTAAMATVQDYFGNNAVRLASWSEDFRELLVRVSGTGHADDYYIFDLDQNSMQMIGQAYPSVPADQIGPVLTIKYKARDGLEIPALLTLPPNTSPENLPMIVMPHGGPESYDAVGFHWMAQFFASRGYMVFQPNFRGSIGFGASFRDAGRGEWGGKMQDDITDGVEKLISSGRADPERICIIGGSYGGYAALAGGAFTPDLYQCVAAIAPVADVPRMLRDERRDHGKNHWVVDYWTDVIGDIKAENEKLQQISPITHANAYTAPVLLLHGKDDLVVPVDQSEAMERALKAADKSVKLVKLKGEDHHLSVGETRLEVLKELDAFVREHIGG